MIDPDLEALWRAVRGLQVVTALLAAALILLAISLAIR